MDRISKAKPFKSLLGTSVLSTLQAPPSTLIAMGLSKAKATQWSHPSWSRNDQIRPWHVASLSQGYPCWPQTPLTCWVAIGVLNPRQPLKEDFKGLIKWRSYLQADRKTATAETLLWSTGKVTPRTCPRAKDHHSRSTIAEMEIGWGKGKTSWNSPLMRCNDCNWQRAKAQQSPYTRRTSGKQSSRTWLERAVIIQRFL